jgi:hypothetical protein
MRTSLNELQSRHQHLLVTLAFRGFLQRDPSTLEADRFVRIIAGSAEGLMFIVGTIKDSEEFRLKNPRLSQSLPPQTAGLTTRQVTILRHLRDAILAAS